jgi:exosortase C (VPDSG-CTERM-specific)
MPFSPQTNAVSITQRLRRTQTSLTGFWDQIKSSRRGCGFLLFFVAISLCCIIPLCDLIQFASKSELYSHIILVPLISVWFLYDRIRGNTGRIQELKPAWSLASVCFTVGLIALGAYWMRLSQGWSPPLDDYLAVMVFAWILFVWGGVSVAFGKAAWLEFMFPLLFLLFMVPFPTFVRNWVETFFQYASADVGFAMITILGIPVFRDGLCFQMPGITIQVAPECSGIHSSLVLFITSFVAGQLFLSSVWKRTVLVLAVIPLAILRNGFRISTISWLCVNVSPDMIHSPIHHRGGPIFFVLSLIPFFALLFFLRGRPRS